MRGTGKIAASHLARAAVIYVRQSTVAQVRNNTESTARQYALAEEAVRLGWAASAVEVIDADLGLSGRTAAARDGFKQLVGRVCVGEVGAIFGLEVSRLARSSADLSKLLELARLTDTLVVDADGVYDLADFNDRILLGLKNTMSEAELHVLASRMDGAKRAAAARGELRLTLAAGYVYDADGAVVIDPDEEVAAAVADLFAAFAAAGSAYGVVAAFRGRRFPRRSANGELEWVALTHTRALSVLTNPVYAGAYVFGRRRSRRTVAADGSIRDRRIDLPQAEWEVLIFDHHPAYLDWQAYLANQERLAANRSSAGARPPREGGALCQGIVHCGACGHAMSTRYNGDHAYYDCNRSRVDHIRTPGCRSIRARSVDEAVAHTLLGVLSAEEVALALAAADEVADRRARSLRAAERAVERARYQADRAERALLACEPENRLVARSLEARWEARLAELVDADAALSAVHADRPQLPPRAELEAAVADLAGLWSAATTSDRDRKRLLRTLIADVTLSPHDDPDKLRVGLRWRSGASDELIVARPPKGFRARQNPPEAVQLVRQLAPTTGDAAIAEALTAAGLRTGVGRTFDAKAVASIRYSHGIPAAGAIRSGEATVAEVARRLGIARSTVIHWIEHGHLHARRGAGDRWLIPFDNDVEDACRQRIAASVHIHPDLDQRPRETDELTPAQVAERLGITRDTVYDWTRRGHIPSRRGPGGRRYLRFTPDIEHACRQLILASPQLPASVKSQTRHATTGDAQ